MVFIGLHALNFCVDTNNMTVVHEIIRSPTNPHSHWTNNDLSKYENQLQATYRQPQQSVIVGSF